MIKIDIISGFLGAGKTTFINKIIREEGAKGTVLIENEFGEIHVDAALLGGKLRIMEISAGCLCCTLQGDFIAGLQRAAAEYRPERILVEPSGAASLPEVYSACGRALAGTGACIRSVITIVSAEALPALYDAGGALYRSQIADASYILMSGAENVKEEDLRECRAILAKLNPVAPVCWEGWGGLRAADVLDEAAEYHGILAAARKARLRVGNRLCAVNFTPDRTADDPWLDGLCAALESGSYGRILRVKGFMGHQVGKTIILEYAPGRGVRWDYADTQTIAAPKLCVIGTGLDRQRLAALFCRE